MLEALFGSGGEADRESDGRVRGVAVAVVTDNQDPEGLGRVRVRFPWLDQGETSYWARLAVPMAGNQMGTYFLPEIGDEVLVVCEREDISHPFVIGSLWHNKQLPPEENDGQNNRRLIRSRSGHELTFDDGPAPSVDLKLENGNHLHLDNDGITLEDQGGNKLEITSTPGSITIKSNTSLRLESQRIELQAGAAMEIKASGTLTINGALVRIN